MLAQEATADNINTMRMNDKATQERQAKERAEALELRNRMKDMTVVVTAKGGGAGRLFGSVTNTEVSEALAKQAGISWTSGRSFWTSRSSRSAFTPSSASSAMRSTQNSKSRSRKPKCA